MNGPIEGYITLQAAADMIGLSRPTLYRRVIAIEQAVNSSRTVHEQPVNSKPISIVQGKKRYISMDYVQTLQQAGIDEQPVNSGEQFMNSAEQFVNSNVNSKMNSVEQGTDSPPGTLKAALRRINDLERALMEAQGKLAALEATIAAQRGQIEYQQQLLDREQMIRLAAEQKKLPAGQGGLFAWIRGRVKNNT